MKSLNIDKDWLTHKYLIENLNIYEIADLIGCHPRTIHQNLIKNQVLRRNKGSHKWTNEERGKRGEWVKTNPEIFSMKGKHHSIDTRIKMSINRRNQGNVNWKGGITAPEIRYRFLYEYKEWRKNILERDNYKCQYENCGEKTNLVHHIKSYKDYPELRIDLNNGLSICKKHHNIIHFTKCPSI